MACIEWNDKYELGINQLDEHHRCLFGIFNNIYECCLNNNQDGVMELVLEELINYSIYHCSEEELLMQDNDYPEQQKHMQEHDVFIRQIARFQQDLLEGNGLLSMEMTQFLSTLLADHIQDFDRKLHAYLISKGDFPSNPSLPGRQ